MKHETQGTISERKKREAKELLLLGWLYRHEYIDSDSYMVCKNRILYSDAQKENAK